MLSFGIIIPVLPKLVEEFAFDNTAKAALLHGLMGTVWTFMQFFCSPVQGALSERFGRRGHDDRVGRTDPSDHRSVRRTQDRIDRVALWGGRLCRIRYRAGGFDLLSRYSRCGFLGTRRSCDTIPHDTLRQQRETGLAPGRHHRHQRRNRPGRTNPLHADLRLLHSIRLRSQHSYLSTSCEFPNTPFIIALLILSGAAGSAWRTTKAGGA